MRFAIVALVVSAAWAGPADRLLKLAPVRFEENRGQLAPGVRYAARGLGYGFVFRDAETALRVGDSTMALVFDGSNTHARFEGVGETGRVNYFVGSLRTDAPAYKRLRRNGVYPGIDLVYYGNGGRLEYDLVMHPGADPARIRLRFRGVAPKLDAAGRIVLAQGVTQEPPRVYQSDGTRVAGRYRMLADGSIGVVLGAYDRNETLVVDPQIVYEAYLGGSYADSAIGVAHDSQGFVYIAGYTFSTDIQLGGYSFNSLNAGNEDVFVMKLNPSAPADSVILYSSYIGGAGNDDPRAMTIDADSNVYVTGVTTSGDFPTTSGAYAAAVADNVAAFVIKLNPNTGGSDSLVYSTVLNGTTGQQSGEGIAVDTAGMIYVAGFTTSTDFPVAGNAIQSSSNGSYDAFVSEIDPAQSGTASLVASTYLGGDSYDVARGIAVDSSGKVYITGVTLSDSWPVTGFHIQGSTNGLGDAFVAELDLAAGNLVYSTYFGGTNYDEGKAIAVNPAGRIVVAGVTLSQDLAVTYNALQLSYGGNADVFVTIIDPNMPEANALVYSTYLGGSGGEVPYDLRVDSAGRIYLGGYTLSGDFPTTSNAYQNASTGLGVDGFVSVLDPAADPGNALVYSSYISGSGTQVVYGVDFDAGGNLFVAGFSTGSIFGSGGPQKPTAGDQDAFVLIVKP